MTFGTNSFPTNIKAAVASAGTLKTFNYASRSALRALVPGTGDIAIVEDLGVFRWDSASVETDDDETCFTTGSSGRWILETTSIDFVLNTISDYFDSRLLVGSFYMSATTLGAQGAVTFDVNIPGAAVGDLVDLSPGLTSAISSTTVSGPVSSGTVISPGLVRVKISNQNAGALGVTPDTWTVFVIKR